jgi:transposase
MAMKRKRASSVSTAHVDGFTAGAIAALSDAGFTQREIADSDAVTKLDGSKVSFGRVGKILRQLAADPGWRGERAEGSGAARATTASEDKAIVVQVKAKRGKEKMTSAKVRRRLRLVVGERTVRRRLREAGLKWLRRRKKRLIPESSVVLRLLWKDRVKKATAKFLKRWVYADGVTFYLDLTAAQACDKKRLALGIYVYRGTDQREALFKDCVGPSSYAKGQGAPVRVWGMLVNGHLNIAVLAAKETINRRTYSKIIRQHYPTWLHGFRGKPLLIQDGEKALWTAEAREALEDISLEVYEQHPPHSPDLNTIENAWHYLRERLNTNQPDCCEDRDAFIRRLRAAVAWVNVHHAATLRYLCRNQKERAEDVALQSGARTKW